ncbi:hypothetical protein WOLCODRAFT_48245, partial [Wolfiporia cocos MD-104 SS10]
HSSSTPLKMSYDATYTFNQPDSDLILRSSDNVDFHVHKLILSLASPVFEAMLPFPHPESSAEDNKDGRPVARMTETARALDLLLRVCYPTANPVLDKADDIGVLMEAARKFDIGVAQTLAMQALTRRELMEEDPLGVYIIACQLQLGDEARKAARLTLRYDHPIRGVAPAGLEHVPATILYELLDYREKCKAAAYSVVSDNAFWQRHWEEFQYELCFSCNPTFESPESSR